MSELIKNEISDDELVSRYISGDNRSLDILIKKNKNKIFSSIILFTRDRNLAEDLFQELWIRVLEKLKSGKYNGKGTFSAWVSRISYNLCVDHYRKENGKKSRKIEMLEDAHLYSLISGDILSEQRLIQSEDNKKIQCLIAHLPEKQQELIMFRHYYDLSFKEISKITGININTLVTRMRYALINLRKIIKNKKIEFY